MREGWEETTLGAVATTVRPTKQSDGPVRYVGLEHFDSGSPRLSRWDSTANFIGTSIAFRAGDVLFSKLRPYLHKVAVADFDGRCTTEALVYRPTTGALGAGYLGLVLQASEAIAYADSSSAGSRMPRTSARIMATLPVALPSVEEQRRIVDLIAAVNDSIEAVRNTKERGAALARSIRDNVFNDNTHSWIRMEEAYDVSAGKQLQSKSKAGDFFPYLRAGNIADGQLDLAVMKEMRFTEAEIDRLTLKAGDVVIVEGGNGYGKSAVWSSDLSPVGFQNHVLRVRPAEDSQYTTEIAFQWARWCHEQGRFKYTGSGIPNLGVSNVRKMQIPRIDSIDPSRIELLTEVDRNATLAEESETRLRDLRSNLLTALLSGEHEIPEAYDGLLEVTV